MFSFVAKIQKIVAKKMFIVISVLKLLNVPFKNLPEKNMPYNM